MPLVVLQCLKKPSWGLCTKPVAEKGMKPKLLGSSGCIYLEMPWLNIYGCVKIKASMMSPSTGFICWAELVPIPECSCGLSLWPADPPLPFLWPEKSFLQSSYCVALTEGPLHSTHITNSFLVYLLFINNSSLLALHCCFFLPRHAFISEFDLCWDTSLKVSEENKRSFLCSVDGVGGWGSTA